MAFAITIGCFTNVLADDTAEVGTANLNNTIENSAKLGDQLLHPEKQWKRYDDKYKNITFVGNWIDPGFTEYYRGTVMTTYNNPSDTYKIQFNFTGNKLRLIAGYNPEYSAKILIKIDGSTEYFAQNLSTTTLRQVISYENISLSNKEHFLEIHTTDNKPLCLDAIDIDSTGELKTYNENPSIIDSSIALNKSTDSLQVGQTDTLTTTITPDNATTTNVTWSSSDPTIATVDSTGKVTAVKEGTATTQDGSNLSASCIVNVTSQSTIPTNPTDNSSNAILTITMTNGNVKSYTVPMTKVNDFINWYDNRVSGSSGKAYYTFDKTDNLQPFTKKTEYLIFDKISSYEVDEYTKQMI
jgi:uncharacterized protein YjdB